MGKVVVIPARTRWQIKYLLLQENMLGREIARKFNVSESVVSRIKHKMMRGESLVPKKKSKEGSESEDESLLADLDRNNINGKSSSFDSNPSSKLNMEQMEKRNSDDKPSKKHIHKVVKLKKKKFSGSGKGHFLNKTAKAVNQGRGAGPVDTDIKTEAVDYDEDFDREWNDEFNEPSTASPILTQALTRDRIPNGHTDQVLNGIDHRVSLDDDLSHSSNSDIISPARIKLEPRDSFDEDNDPSKARFNLRKRKASMTLENSGSSVRDGGDGETGLEEDSNGKKKRKKIQYTYTNNMLQEALDLVQSQNISIMNAAKQYGIPRSTLRRYALTVWAAAAPKSKSRQEPALAPPEEAHLVSMITKMSRAGKYVSTMDVKSTVQHLLDESERVVFKDRNRPNAGWVQRFRKRHRDLQIKGSGYTMKRHTPLTKQDVNEWYNEITQYLTTDWELNFAEFFTDENRHRVFNLDEMTLPLNCKSDLIEESIPKTEEDFAEATILAAVSAAGECMQPLIIQKGEGGGHEDDIMPLDQNSYGISFSISGKMNSDIFLRWLEAFDRELSEKGIQKPILIYLDDIFAHFHISVFSYAMDNDIILICLQTQIGAMLHPVEAEITDKVKNTYRIFCREHYKVESAPVSIDLFPLTFLRAWETVRANESLRENLRKSFSFMGLFPINPNAPVYADFPLYAEIPAKDPVKLEKTYKKQEPKAKKTIPKMLFHSSDEGLIPKVKIKKLDKNIASDHYKIVEECGNNFSSTAAYSDQLDSLSYSDPEPMTKVETKWIGTPRVRKTAVKGSEESPFPLHISKERLEGRQDGIKKCIDLMESLIPSDLIPVYRNRPNDLKTSCEIPFCMWRAVQNMFADLTLQLERQTKVLSRCPQLYKSMQGPSKPYTKKKPKTESLLANSSYL